MSEAAFSYGQAVEVSPTSPYAMDWIDVKLWVAGITYDFRTKALNYWLSEHWPPNHEGDITDGWSEDMLSAVGASPTEREMHPRETAIPPTEEALTGQDSSVAGADMTAPSAASDSPCKSEGGAS